MRRSDFYEVRAEKLYYGTIMHSIVDECDNLEQAKASAEEYLKRHPADEITINYYGNFNCTGTCDKHNEVFGYYDVEYIVCQLIYNADTGKVEEA